MSAIEFADVCKTYGQSGSRNRVAALCHLKLQIEAGEVFALAGPNGAGKTTAIRILLGLCRPDSGQVGIFAGHDAVYSSGTVGFAPEEADLPEFLSVDELLQTACGLSGITPAPARLDRAVKMLELSEDRHRRVGELSKGTRQRVSLAAAIVHEPRLVIFDEPASGLDPIGRQLVRNVIREVHSQGATVFFTTHILADLPGLCSRIGILRQGELVFSGTPAEFCGSDALPALEERFAVLVRGSGS